jgi:hypothetical protein
VCVYAHIVMDVGWWRGGGGGAAHGYVKGCMDVR